MIFETHAHYDDEKFDEDRNELLGSFHAAGIEKVVNIGSSIKSSYTTVDLTKQYDFIYGAVGIHPESIYVEDSPLWKDFNADQSTIDVDSIEINKICDEDMKIIESLLSNEKILAVGEIGLDYYYEGHNKELQKKWFLSQLDIARRNKYPVIIHSRDAAKDTLDIMKSERAGEIGGVIHCYSYSKEIAREYLDMGYYIGIGGVVTFKNAAKLKEVVEYLPLESIVLETDCPYLAPVPHRGKRNSSLYLGYVADEIADIKGISREKVEEITYDNAMKLYRL